MKRILFFLFLFFFNTSIFAETIQSVVIFGDSLSDNGNLYNILRIPSSPPYYEGRFSNGPTWAEYVGNYFYNTQYASYANYAYGGATAILHHLRSDSFIAPVLLGEEVDSYLLHSVRNDRDQTLFAIWIGANDYLYERMPDINKLTDDVVAKILESMVKVIDKGGKHFIVLNLPDLSQIPYARNHDLVDRLAAISKFHNQKLAEGISLLKITYPNIEIRYMDIDAIFADILKYPDKYNEKYGTHVTDLTNSCWLGGMIDRKNKNITIQNQNFASMIENMPNQTFSGLVPCANPENFLFWDDMHPTAIIHKILGQIIVEEWV